jgi:transcriptional regulator with XRE-family HTH domain
MLEKRQKKIITSFGSKVKEIRTKKNLTQFDLAVKAGLDIRQIQRIENGQTNTSLTSIYSIADPTRPRLIKNK